MSWIFIALALLAFVLSFLFDLGRVRRARRVMRSFRVAPMMPGVMIYKRGRK